MAESIEVSGLSQGGHSSKTSERTNYSGALCKGWSVLCRLSAMRLNFCALFALMSFATALECVIDLKPIGDSGFAQCEAGCNFCGFTLEQGTFHWGAIECLANVQCYIQIKTLGDLNGVTVDGTQASALTVDTDGAEINAWVGTEFYLPANGGNFRFEIRNTQTAARFLKFYAQYSGVVDIIFHSDGVSAVKPELMSMSVYASTAEALNVYLFSDTKYSQFDDCFIQCPAAGTCLWHSEAEKFAADALMIDITSYPRTQLQIVCGNPNACTNVVVNCNNSAETCSMEYSSDWQCIGALDLETDCVVPLTSTTVTPTTTTETPTTTTETPTTETPTTTTETPTTTTETPTTTTAIPSTTALPTFMFTTSTPELSLYFNSSLLPETTPPLAETTPHNSSGGNGNDWNLVHVLIFAIATFSCLGLCVVCGCKAAKKMGGSEEAAEHSLDAEGSIHLEESNSGPKETEETTDENGVVIKIGEAKKSKLAKFSAVSERQTAIERMVMSETRDAFNVQLTAAVNSRHSETVGDEVTDTDSRMLYSATRGAIERMVVSETRGAGGVQLTAAAKSRDTGTVGDAGMDLEDKMLYSAETANGGDTQTGGKALYESPVSARIRSHSDSLIEDQPEGVYATDTTATHSHGAIGDAVADEDLEEQMLHFARSD